LKKFPTDYHDDYVFKDGKLVGDFEGMCRHSSDIPWRQDAQDAKAAVSSRIIPG